MQSMESFAGLLAAAGPGILEVEGTGAGEPSSSSSSTENVSILEVEGTGAGEPSSSSSSTDNVSNSLGVGAGLEGVVTIMDSSFLGGRGSQFPSLKINISCSSSGSLG